MEVSGSVSVLTAGRDQARRAGARIAGSSNFIFNLDLRTRPEFAALWLPPGSFFIPVTAFFWSRGDDTPAFVSREWEKASEQEDSILELMNDYILPAVTDQ
jgi:hypothetical protein